MTAASPKSRKLTLRAETAGDLMSANPISLRVGGTVREAMVVLLDRDVAAAPVIDEAGRPVGVISVTDILVHERQASLPLGVQAELSAAARFIGKLRDEFEIEVADPTTVGEVMTPGIFAVKQDCSTEKVVADMLKYRVHRLFVQDGECVIIGVISTTDILRNLTR